MKTRPWINVNELDTPTSVDAYDAIEAASFVLFMLSGQRYTGLQSTTEQYFCETSGAPNNCSYIEARRFWWNHTQDIAAYQVFPRGYMMNGSRFRLAHRPVVRVTEVIAGGRVIPPSDYSVLNGELLERTGSWGVCDSPIITYEFGVRPPALGRMAARRLANELVLAADGDSKCRLPTGVTSVSREGINMEIFDPQDFMDKGRTGLYEVDLFIATVNPAKAKKRPRIFSVDQRRGYRTS